MFYECAFIVFICKVNDTEGRDIQFIIYTYPILYQLLDASCTLLKPSSKCYLLVQLFVKFADKQRMLAGASFFLLIR